MDERRLAIFLPSLAGGGAERMMLHLARGVLAEGIACDLVLVTAAGPLRSLVPPGARVVQLGGKRVLGALPALVTYLRRQRPEALLGTMDHASIVALWARALARVPTRVYAGVRNTLSEDARHASGVAERLMPHLARAFYPRAQAVIAVSAGVAEDVEGLIGRGRARVVAVPNPVVMPELATLAQATPAHPWLRQPGLRVILGAGRLTYQKGFDTLLRAFAALPDAADLRLVILGEGPEREHLESLGRDLGITARLALPGFVDNPFAYMARARLFVLSSRWEGLPGVLIQAMACGTSVVSTDCPSGPAEILQGGRYGPLVPVGDAHLLTAAMAGALAGPVQSQALQARAGVYDLHRATRRYLEVMDLIELPAP